MVRYKPMIADASGQILLSGELSFETAPHLLEQGYRVLRDNFDANFDLSAVSHTDSAGLALIIAWCRFAKQNSGRPRFIHIPEALCSLMRVTNVETVLKEFLA